MYYSLESAKLWDHTLPNKENWKPVAIILKSKDFKDDAKFKHQKKYADKIIAWIKDNVKCKS